VTGCDRDCHAGLRDALSSVEVFRGSALEDNKKNAGVQAGFLHQALV
jgi:hypothetical protein